MKQLRRTLCTLAALWILTIYFFADLVLIEPAAPEVVNALAGPSSVGPGAAPQGEDGKRADESSTRPAFSEAVLFRGMTGSSGGIVSSGKARWHRLYRWWRTGGNGSKTGRKLVGNWSEAARERLGEILTLLSLCIVIGGISLVISQVEERASA